MEYMKALMAWIDKNIRTDTELAQALNIFRTTFAYNSGKIDNPKVNHHDIREIFDQNIVTSCIADPHTLAEICNARQAYELFLFAFQNRRPLNEALIKEFQYELTKNTYDVRHWLFGERSGKYKRYNNLTWFNKVGTAPDKVAREMAKLVGEIRDVTPGKALTAAAYFLAKFECICPFSEGNGKTGRLAMNYLLVTNGHPPVVFYEQDRLGYFMALKIWSERQDLEPMRNFLVIQTKKTWDR